MDYQLEMAEKNDLPEIVLLYKEAITDMILHNILQWDDLYPNEQILSEDIENGKLWLLRKDKKIIACAVINEEQDEEYCSGNWKYREGNVVVLHRLCVHPNAQGGGIGRRMVQLVEELSMKMGYSILRLDAFSQNPGARHLYESLGYTYSGEVTFRKGTFVLMEKLLK